LKGGLGKEGAEQAGEKSELFAGGGTGKLPLEEFTRQKKEGSRNATQLPSKVEITAHRQNPY
jgi:hypothetical protein